MRAYNLAPRPPGLPPEDHSTERKRHITRACEKCRSRRTKCDGKRPCGNCQQLQLSCEYLGYDNRRKADQQARIRALEQRNEYLERLVQQLSSNNILSATASSGSGSGAGISQETTPANLHNGLMSTPSYNQNDLMDIFYAGTAAYPELHTPQLSVSGYRANGLPEEQFAEYAIDGFFRCAATLFFVKTQQEARQLLYRVYHDSRIAIGDISELCALAAIGSHYDMNRVPQEARAIFFYRASTTLNGTIPLDSIQGVRIFICLCMNCIMDKSTTARTLIVSTLGLARLQITKELRDVAVERGSESQYRRLLRTLIFLEGWVSYSLGYQSCLLQTEINLIQNIEAEMFEEYGAGSSTVNTIQSQMAKMVVLAVEEYKKITQLRSDLWTEIHRGSDSLNNWLRELPASLHLSALGETDTDLTPQQVTAIYLMHTLFIDTHLLLYFRFIDFSYRSDANADGLAIERIFLDMPHSIFSTYTEFSIQLARIIALLYDQEKVFARCWMVIHATFDAMSMMLLSVCQTYYTSYESDIPQMMNLLDSCFRVLRFCSESDFVASRFVDMLTPTFFDVQSFDRLHEPDRMSISYVLNIEQVDQAAIRHTLCQLLEIISIERHKAWI